MPRCFLWDRQTSVGGADICGRGIPAPMLLDKKEETGKRGSRIFVGVGSPNPSGEETSPLR